MRGNVISSRNCFHSSSLSPAPLPTATENRVFTAQFRSYNRTVGLGGGRARHVSENRKQTGAVARYQSCDTYKTAHIYRIFALENRGRRVIGLALQNSSTTAIWIRDEKSQKRFSSKRRHSQLCRYRHYRSVRCSLPSLLPRRQL